MARLDNISQRRTSHAQLWEANLHLCLTENKMGCRIWVLMTLHCSLSCEATGMLFILATWLDLLHFQADNEEQTEYDRTQDAM